jgi:hypothetical protein
MQVARIRPFMPLAATAVVVLIVGSMIACNVEIVGRFGAMVRLGGDMTCLLCQGLKNLFALRSGTVRLHSAVPVLTSIFEFQIC